MKVHALPDVEREVRRRFELLSRSYSEAEVRCRPPAPHVLLRLLDEAFWTSISRDEGRPCRLTIAYYEHPPPGEDLAIALDAKQLDRRYLRRLAAVAAAADAKIAVTGGEQDLHIIGLAKRFRWHTDTSDSPVEIPIEIEVVGPGDIVLRWAHFRMLTYRGGEILEPAPNILYLDGPFLQALNRLAATDGIPGKDDLKHTEPGEDISFNLMNLLRRVERNAHGGLFILSSTRPRKIESVSWPIVNHTIGLADHYRPWWDNLRRFHLPEDHTDKLSFDALYTAQEELKFLQSEVLTLAGSLALTDGAVWLNGSLRPMAFGVFTEFTPGLSVHIAGNVAATDLQPRQFDDLGARHRAMVALAGHNIGCPAIAISEDGGFSAALRAEGRDYVFMWASFQGKDLEADDLLDPQRLAIRQNLLTRTKRA